MSSGLSYKVGFIRLTPIAILSLVVVGGYTTPMELTNKDGFGEKIAALAWSSYSLYICRMVELYASFDLFVHSLLAGILSGPFKFIANFASYTFPPFACCGDEFINRQKRFNF